MFKFFFVTVVENMTCKRTHNNLYNLFFIYYYYYYYYYYH